MPGVWARPMLKVGTLREALAVPDESEDQCAEEAGGASTAWVSLAVRP